MRAIALLCTARQPRLQRRSTLPAELQVEYIPNCRYIRAIHEELAATQEEITSMAVDREAAVERCHQMQLSIAGGGGGGSGYGNCYALMKARLRVRTQIPGTFSVMQFFFPIGYT